jgi:acetyl-CoA carboxylase carboxyltransferase component
MAETAKDLLEKVEAFRATVMDEGRPDAVSKRRTIKRMTLRERITAILDDGSFREFGALVEPLRATRWNADLVAPADGIVCGRGAVDARPIMVYGTDFTVHGGSTGRHGMLKHARLAEQALRNGFPVVYLLEGGGHRIQDGLDARYFSAGSSVFQNLARLSGWVPIATAMMGVGFAGPTNYAAMSDFVVMIRNYSTLGIAGPALVKASTGEDLDKEKLGGAAIQVDRNGLADLAVDTEEEALAAVRKFLSYFPTNARAPLPVLPCDDPIARREEALVDLVPADTRKAYDVMQVIKCIVDHDSVFELKPTYARNIVTTLARLNGRPVGIVANQPRYRAGMLDTPACEKAARFIALCDAFGLPLVMLIDVPGFAVGSAAESTGIARKSARLFFELGQSSVPRVSIALRKGYGAAYYAMGGGRSFEADGAFCWPTAELGALSVEGAVDVAYRRQWEGAAEPQIARSELVATLKSQLGALSAASSFGLDDVLDPRDTRRRLIEIFDECPPRRQNFQPPKVRQISPI